MHFLPPPACSGKLTLLGFLLPRQGATDLAQERLVFFHPVGPQRRRADGSRGHGFRLGKGSTEAAGPSPAVPCAGVWSVPRSRTKLCERRGRGKLPSGRGGEQGACEPRRRGGQGAGWEPLPPDTAFFHGGEGRGRRGRDDMTMRRGWRPLRWIVPGTRRASRIKNE